MWRYDGEGIEEWAWWLCNKIRGRKGWRSRERV